jgi:hypothetical protein
LIIMEYNTHQYAVGKVVMDISVSKDRQDCQVSGFINENVLNNKLFYDVAAPANNTFSYSGSGLPWPNQELAFSAKNVGAVLLLESTPNGEKNKFTIRFKMPNSYYTDLGTVLVEPELYISYNNGFVDKQHVVHLWRGIAHRTLTYSKERKNCLYYATELPVRDQETILRDSKYNIDKDDNDWMLRPRV